MEYNGATFEECMAATIEGLFSRLKFVAATLLLGASSAHAWSTIDVMSAISCNADLNREFYQQKRTQYYGKILRNARFAPANMFFDEKNNKWVGSDGRQMVWHEQKYAKVFCIGMRDGR